MERLILITLVVADAISAIGFVLAAKSLARYQELNNREFAEYYLVGTLTSFTLALFAGLWLGPPLNGKTLNKSMIRFLKIKKAGGLNFPPVFPQDPFRHGV